MRKATFKTSGGATRTEKGGAPKAGKPKMHPRAKQVGVGPAAPNRK